ncbi:NUDIX hydrolase [Roseicitreum antarcticum]|uniref:8-oxo-dGTP pyrophosphatase MutT, NUDIX family n=1 Tax=Roseicitreum antarcticum TaxID=564137 RepID=A0A1H2R871_9RHOB|nr:NUDIX hydrolase [Roseicitreum antarcticum]SDW15330.1 8-oxo-dGTP pyrophosphatase MutT, NUDIX family [Roseicitreum antarcticum]
MKHSNLSLVLTEFVGAFTRRPAYLQVAALCTRGEGSQLQVLMIRSLQTQRWIIPKGWPMEDRTLAGAALQEAWEEAGVQGTVSEETVGAYTYRKIRKNGLPVPCRAQVFHVQVTGLADTFPEVKKRRRKWMRPQEAATVVAEADLATLLRSL